MKKIKNYHNDFEKYNIGSAYSGTYEHYLLNKYELHNYNVDILYESKTVSLLCYNNNIVVIKNKNIYELSSYPYEPCLYIKFKNKIIVTIHNFFSVSEIINIAKEYKTIKSISGIDYNIEKICNILLLAIDNNVSDTDISYLENFLKTNTHKSTKKIDNKKQYNHIKSLKENNNLIELTNDIFYKEYKKYPDCVLDYCIIQNNSTYNSIKSHKEAVIFAMEKWKTNYDYDLYYNPKKMTSTKIDSEMFFENTLKDNSYYYLFSKPPHGNNYTINDFNKINNILFPNGFNNLDIYEWSTNWSNYFEDGLEWWGARCVSIYDNKLNRFVVIGASATD